MQCRFIHPRVRRVLAAAIATLWLAAALPASAQPAAWTLGRDRFFQREGGDVDEFLSVMGNGTYAAFRGGAAGARPTDRGRWRLRGPDLLLSPEFGAEFLAFGPLRVDVRDEYRRRLLPLLLADLRVFMRRRFADEPYRTAQVEAIRSLRAPGGGTEPAIRVQPATERITWLELAGLEDLIELYLDTERRGPARLRLASHHGITFLVEPDSAVPFLRDERELRDWIERWLPGRSPGLFLREIGRRAFEAGTSRQPEP